MCPSCSLLFSVAVPNNYTPVWDNSCRLVLLLTIQWWRSFFCDHRNSITCEMCVRLLLYIIYTAYIKQELMKHLIDVECSLKKKIQNIFWHSHIECIIHSYPCNMNQHQTSSRQKYCNLFCSCSLLWQNELCQNCPSQVKKMGRTLAFWDMRLYCRYTSV